MSASVKNTTLVFAHRGPSACIAVIVSVTTTGAMASKPFQGVLELRIANDARDEKSHVVTELLYVSPIGVRMESADNATGKVSAALLLRNSPKVAFVIDPENRTYTRRRVDRPRGGRAESFTVERLELTKVAAWTCQHVRLSGSHGTEIEEWLSINATDLEEWAKMFVNHDESGSRAALEEAGVRGIPLKVVIRVGDGRRRIAEVTRVTKRRVPAAMFDLSRMKEVTEHGD